MQRRFRQVDVFTSEPYLGNPLAVVLDAEGLTTEEMVRFARWTNLSETTFLLPPEDPEADYRVRIFTSSSATPQRPSSFELPFAGHPTLGTCHVWLEAAGAPKDDSVIIQECGAGLIPIRRLDGVGLAFAAPPLLRSGPVEEAVIEHIASVLAIERGEIVDAAWADNGPGWVAVLLESADAVLALRPGFMDLDLGVIGPCAPGSPEAFEVRAFFPKDGATAEDPVTGSLNASLAQWLIGSGRAMPPYVTRQGTALGRAGRVSVSCDADGAVWVGGAAVTCITGTVELD
jgi:PhzF family phenazine biosynthesis protein